MDTPTKTEPPFIPMRRRGWATRRTPVWVFAAIVVIVAATVVLSLVHKPSQAERASDLRGYLGDVNTDIESCAGGMRDAMKALDAVESGDTAEYSATIGILQYSAQNCSPANNESLEDFTGYEVIESLASLNLDTADNDVITWVFDAQAAQNDMVAELEAKTPAAKAAATTTLAVAMNKANAERATIYGIWRKAQQSTGEKGALPFMPT